MNLQRLAELISARWPDKWVGKSRFDGTGLTVHDKLMLDIFGKTVDNTEAWVSYYPENGSRHNGAFLDWCLDRLEELGLAPLLRQGGELYVLVAGSDLGPGIVEIEEDGTETVDGIPYRPEPFPVARIAFTGATRAEACALALMQALEGE